MKSEFDSQLVSLKKMPGTQSKRNYHRTKKFRDQNSTEISIEIPRTSEENKLKASTPICLGASKCIDDSCLLESPVIHLNSDHDQSCEEPFHDIPDSVIFVRPDSVGSVLQEVKSKPKVRKPQSVLTIS